MAPRPMVLVASAQNEIHAQIIGARLGAEGIVWELRPSVGAPYSVGAVGVLVEADRVEDARELLIADDVEAVFDEGPSGHDIAPANTWLLAGAVLFILAFIVVRLMSLG